MTTFHETFKFETEIRPSFMDVTEKIKKVVNKSDIQNGIVVVYSQHTTCSIIIQEDSLDETYNRTKNIFQDLLDVLDPIIPPCKREGQYMHPGPLCVDYSTNVVKEDISCTLNTDAHLRSSLIGRSEAIPLVNGNIELGDHGRIYFADFDGTRSRIRIVQIQIVGD